MTQLLALAVLVGFAGLVWRFVPEESPEDRNFRARRAASSKPISQEALRNILRLELNEGDKGPGSAS